MAMLLDRPPTKATRAKATTATEAPAPLPSVPVRPHPGVLAEEHLGLVDVTLPRTGVVKRRFQHGPRTAALEWVQGCTNVTLKLTGYDGDIRQLATDGYTVTPVVDGVPCLRDANDRNTTKPFSNTFTWNHLCPTRKNDQPRLTLRVNKPA